MCALAASQASACDDDSLDQAELADASHGGTPGDVAPVPYAGPPTPEHGSLADEHELTDEERGEAM
eukprot:11063868-Karenia_brevis.AAC.1